jgi:hypothetical protein
MTNQVLLEGYVRSIRKIITYGFAGKKLVESFHIDIPRSDVKDGFYSPIILVISDELSKKITGILKESMHVNLKAHLETEVKGHYGTVTTIVADEITII